MSLELHWLYRQIEMSWQIELRNWQIEMGNYWGILFEEFIDIGWRLRNFIWRIYRHWLKLFCIFNLVYRWTNPLTSLKTTLFRWLRALTAQPALKLTKTEWFTRQTNWFSKLMTGQQLKQPNFKIYEFMNDQPNFNISDSTVRWYFCHVENNFQNAAY